MSDDIKLTPEQLKELSDVLMSTIGDSIGTLQALDSLSKSLENLRDLVKGEEYERASTLGYNGIATEFIWLQRCLGALQTANLRKDAITSDVAFAHRKPFEEVAPAVEAAWKSLKDGT